VIIARRFASFSHTVLMAAALAFVAMLIVAPLWG
jgi:hypothetical protein